jgi:hypothetical protein
MSAATGDVTLNSDSGALQYQASSGTLSSTFFSGSGASLTSLPVSQLSAAVPVTKGGTGLDTVTENELLLGPGSGTALIRLAPYTADSTKKFLRSNNSGVAWDDVSSTTMTVTNDADSTNDQGIIYTEGGTGIKSLESDANTLKYKRSTGTLTTSNVITSDTSIHARNGIANTTPTHTLDIGSNVSVIDAGVDKLVIRGNVYSTNDIISLGTIHSDIIKSRDIFCKTRTIVAERPSRQIRLN